MKKIIFPAVFIAIFALTVVPALGATLDVGLNYGTYTGLGTKDIREGIMAIVRVLFGFLGILSIIIVLYGGFTWMTSGGSEEKVSQAKKIISAGVIGLVIIFISYALASFAITQLMLATGATA